MQKCRLHALLFISVVFLIGISFGQEKNASGTRDPRALEIITRVVAASGGPKIAALLQDVAETGEVTFYRDKSVNAPITLLTLGHDHFRMDAYLPDGKATWIVRSGVGSNKEADKTLSIPTLRAVSLCDLSLPIAYALDAMADPQTDVFLVGVEQRQQRSVYRVRLHGQLGASGTEHAVLQTKELLIDVLTFDIVAAEDHPFPRSMRFGAAVKPSVRQVSFRDFRMMSGMRVPFSISETVFGQQTLSIRLREISFGGHLSDADFRD